MQSTYVGKVGYILRVHCKTIWWNRYGRNFSWQWSCTYPRIV